MSTKFVPLTLELIDEGEFLKQANRELMRIQGELRAYRKLHGKAAGKAAAALTLTVNLQCEKADDTYSVKSTLKTTLPGPPPSTTLAMGGETQDDLDCLFIKRSGSSSDDPRQQIICTRDGRKVDQGTGEVIED